MLQQEHPKANAVDDYWQQEEHLARLPLPPLDVESDVFFLWHYSRERYGKGHREISVRLTDAGERDYVHAKACYYSPRIVLTIGLTSPALAEPGEEIGEVLDERREGQTRHFIAGLQAWYYAAEKTLMLWEVDLSGQYAGDDPAEDFLLSSLWHFFEAGLLRRFPDCERVVTPGWEPDYDGDRWREFLRGRGYAPHVENTFIKHVSRAEVAG
jgi:hypothetical protein